jgi:hypothetical protein
MKYSDKERFKARKDWIKKNPDVYKKMVVEEKVLCVDKFYDCDEDYMILHLYTGKPERPLDLFPEDAVRFKHGPKVVLISCDDASLEKTFEPGEIAKAREMFSKIIEMQPISFKELEDMGFKRY